MAFLDDMDRKLSQLGQSALKKTKDMSESMRLSGANREEEEKQKELCRKIGEYIFENQIELYEEPIRGWCQEISASMERVIQNNDQLNALKGTTTCPVCGAALASGVVFCSTCGSRIEEVVQKKSDEKICPNCGRKGDRNTIFCTYCGTRMDGRETMEEIEKMSENICPNCGNKIKPDQMFCVKCGTKIPR